MGEHCPERDQEQMVGFLGSPPGLARLIVA